MQYSSYRWLAGGAMRRTRVRRVPLASEALGFDELVRGHET
jgi:hypothetical protein